MNHLYTTIPFETLASTNSKAMDLAAAGEREISLIIASSQLAGKGQQNNTWESEDGMNITCSWILEPVFLPQDQLFILSKVFSVAVVNTVKKETGLEATIKWPNDIYIGAKKLAGILIEHVFWGNALKYSVIGLGLNVNQTKFLSEAPNPTSLKLETGKDYDVSAFTHAISAHFIHRYLSLKTHPLIDQKLYMDLLYRGIGYHLYQLPSGDLFTAKILDVCADGYLVLENIDKQINRYYFKEVIFANH